MNAQEVAEFIVKRHVLVARVHRDTSVSLFCYGLVQLAEGDFVLADEAFRLAETYSDNGIREFPGFIL